MEVIKVPVFYETGNCIYYYTIIKKIYTEIHLKTVGEEADNILPCEKTQIIQASLGLKSLLLKAGSKSHNTTAHSLMHGLLATTCKAFGMQQPPLCNPNCFYFGARVFVFNKELMA